MGSDITGAALELRSVAKSFAGESAVDDVTLDIAPGEFMTFLGPSGSGKTTTLNMIAGFVQPSSGQILLGNAEISRVPPHRRGIGMVFQHYALFPHMTVQQNVAYPLKQRRVPRGAREVRVAEALKLVRLEALANRRPHQLSGGQQQRVALARALVFRPPVLLMDEPLGALDRRLREDLQLEIKRIHEELEITFVYVTHDQDEALLLSDRIAVFRDGQIDQVGPARELYEHPRTMFVAEFLGDSNIFTGTVDPAGSVVRLGHGPRIHADGCSPARPGQCATVLVRPERVRLLDSGATGYRNTFEGVVASVLYLGNSRKVEVDTGSGLKITVREAAGDTPARHPGDQVIVGWNPGDCVVIPEADSGTAEQAPSSVVGT